MWYKNLLRADNGLNRKIVRVTEEIDKGIKHKRDITKPPHGMPLFHLGGLWHASILYYRMYIANIMG